MTRVVLHIGAPKSGTTSLQRYFDTNRIALRALGLTYLTPPGKTSANPVAVAINRERAEETSCLSAYFSDQLTKVSDTALISSEMFFGLGPKELSPVLPDLSPENAEVLVYLRRQDRYLESKYAQKLKNGRFKGTIHDYIAKWDGSGADYRQSLAPWHDAGFRLRVRVCEPNRLIGGSVVTDALSIIGIDGAPPQTEAHRSNTSPSWLRLQLLQAAEAAGADNLIRLQRRLPAETGAGARFLTPAERHDIMARYADANEDLRRKHFPGSATLFSMEDIDTDAPSDKDSLTDTQLREIEAVMRALLETR